VADDWRGYPSGSELVCQSGLTTLGNGMSASLVSVVVHAAAGQSLTLVCHFMWQAYLYGVASFVTDCLGV